tara:strand:+ start:8895 stop:9968 length:1074 start_codon:yes stop_codon:yes gene_type:complete
MRAISSPQQMYDVVEAAFFAGINHIETSPVYGPAEEFLGEALQSLQQKAIYPEGGLVVTSKILPGVSFKEGKTKIKNMLSRLSLSRIDNLAIHGINLEDHLHWTLNGEGADLLKWAEEENLIGQVGFSSHGSLPLIKEAITSHRFGFCSLHLHLLDPERLPLARIALKQGMGVMAISPADKGGQLYRPSKTLIEDCHPISPIELAYRFLLAQQITTLTIGATKIEDLNLARKLTSEIQPLNIQEQSAIKRLNENERMRLGETFCGQCRACLPCPNNIPITDILRLRNLNIGHDLITFTKERYNLINKAGHWWETVNASSCKGCGECIPRCPNNLQIPNLLEDAHIRMADKPSRRLWD